MRELGGQVGVALLEGRLLGLEGGEFRVVLGDEIVESASDGAGEVGEQRVFLGVAWNGRRGQV